MQILLCGAGTLGGNLAEHLVRRHLLVGELDLKVIDGDRVEARNLANQPYFAHQVGKPKVAALAENVFRISGGRLQVHHKTLTGGNAERWMQGCQLVLDCFDNHEARRAVQAACRVQHIDCLHLGLAADYGEAIWDEHYVVPPDVERDPCSDPLSRWLALMTVTLFEQIWEAYQKGQRRNLCFTARDLAVSSPVLGSIAARPGGPGCESCPDWCAPIPVDPWR